MDTVDTCVLHFNFQWFPRVISSFKLPEVLDEVSVESPKMFDSRLTLLTSFPSTVVELESLWSDLPVCSSLTLFRKSTSGPTLQGAQGGSSEGAQWLRA